MYSNPGRYRCGSVGNTATASYTCGGINYTETAEESVPADRRPGLTISKTVNFAKISAPVTLTYTITVTNTGNVSLTGWY
ncbi:MAG: hypothetical protein IPI74_11240 [Bacteroidales bacterium]|nr:hypothetical protein [Bacteroidales bacterium]